MALCPASGSLVEAPGTALRFGGMGSGSEDARPEDGSCMFDPVVPKKLTSLFLLEFKGFPFCFCGKWNHCACNEKTTPLKLGPSQWLAVFLLVPFDR